MYKLYNVKRWGSMSAHFVLEELGVPYQNIWMTAEQVAAPEFREISPLGFIPALGLADGRAIFESAAIVAFLTTSHADKGLAPPIGSEDHATYLSQLLFLAVNLYPAINLASGDVKLVDSEAAKAVIMRNAIAYCDTLFDIVESRLKSDGPFLAGEHYSAADIYLFMLTIWAKPGEAALHVRCPHIARICEFVRARPRLKAALEAHGVLALAEGA
jgi:glutathione S-transferase